MNWQAVWERRTLDRTRPILEALMAADGLDTGFGNVSPESWRAFVRSIAQRLALGPGSSVFEVGCGAGAFLHELAALGCTIGGLDASPALIGFAREALPLGDFLCSAAEALPATPQVEVVASCGVFLYFPSLDYAHEVLRRMSAKATRAIAVLDVPDLAKQDAALLARRATLGPAEYEKKYKGLDHRYYPKAWMSDALHALGFARVAIEDQAIEGYANGAFRFNAIAWRD